MSGFTTPTGGLPYIVKDPDAKLDYRIDWTAWLAGDAIQTATCAAPGLVLESTTNTASAVTVWLSGGVDGQSYTVTCSIVSTGGRRDDRSFVVMCRQR